MTEREQRPERHQGDYDPAEDPDTDPPASGENPAADGPDGGGEKDDRDDDASSGAS